MKNNKLNLIEEFEIKRPNGRFLKFKTFSDYIEGTPYDLWTVLYDFIHMPLLWSSLTLTAPLLLPDEVIKFCKANCVENSIFIKSFCNQYQKPAYILPIIFYDDRNKHILSPGHFVPVFTKYNKYYVFNYFTIGLGNISDSISNSEDVIAYVENAYSFAYSYDFKARNKVQYKEDVKCCTVFLNSKELKNIDDLVANKHHFNQKQLINIISDSMMSLFNILIKKEINPNTNPNDSLNEQLKIDNKKEKLLKELLNMSFDSNPVPRRVINLAMKKGLI